MRRRSDQGPPYIVQTLPAVRRLRAVISQLGGGGGRTRYERVLFVTLVTNFAELALAAIFQGVMVAALMGIFHLLNFVNTIEMELKCIRLRMQIYDELQENLFTL